MRALLVHLWSPRSVKERLYNNISTNSSSLVFSQFYAKTRRRENDPSNIYMYSILWNEYRSLNRCWKFTENVRWKANGSYVLLDRVNYKCGRGGKGGERWLRRWWWCFESKWRWHTSSGTSSFVKRLLLYFLMYLFFGSSYRMIPPFFPWLHFCFLWLTLCALLSLSLCLSLSVSIFLYDPFCRSPPPVPSCSALDFHDVRKPGHNCNRPEPRPKLSVRRRKSVSSRSFLSPRSHLDI